MKNYKVLIYGLLLVLLNSASAGLTIHYIRHAEGGHNVKDEWEEKGVPKSEWPAYVGDHNAFTPKGKEQVKEATKRLAEHKYDHILCSPAWRARNTILPYLKNTKQTAQVWPELKESSGRRYIFSEKLVKVNKEILNKGDEIEIPDDEKAFFTLREDAANHYLKYPKGSDDVEKAAYLRYVTEHAIKLIENDFGDSDKTILVAGHNNAGVSLIHLLLGKELPRSIDKSLKNAQGWVAERQEDGTYKLLSYNGASLTDEQREDLDGQPEQD